MATYDNPRNGAVHWVANSAQRTACGLRRVVRKSRRYDSVGDVSDVKCGHCEETAAFLEAMSRAPPDPSLVAAQEMADRECDELLREEETMP
jgi:hypothetical protein